MLQKLQVIFRNPFASNPWDDNDQKNHWQKKRNNTNNGDSLEQIYEKVQSFFGGGGGGSSNDNNNGAGNFNSLIQGLLLVLVIMWLASGVYRVEDNKGEQAVILRFGKFARVEGSGLKFRLPFPIEEHIIRSVSKARTFNIGRSNRESINMYERSNKNQKQKSNIFRIRLGSGGRPVDSDQAFMLTSDFNIVNVSASVLWSIKDLRGYLFQAKDPIETLHLVAESVLRQVIAKNNMETAFTKGKLAIQQEVMMELQTIVDKYKLGIAIRQVELQEVAEPLPVRNAFLDVERARQDKAKKKNDAEAYRDSVLPMARGKAQQIINGAKARRKTIIENANGLSSRFNNILKEYHSASPEVRRITRQHMRMEVVENVLKDATKIVVDKNGAQGVLPYLPLQGLTGHGKPATKTVQHKILSNSGSINHQTTQNNNFKKQIDARSSAIN